jgi:hypothetical protein
MLLIGRNSFGSEDNTMLDQFGTKPLTRQSGPWRGDINNDGIINDLDITALADSIMSDKRSRYLDINEDQNVNVADVVTLVNKIDDLYLPEDYDFLDEGIYYRGNRHSENDNTVKVIAGKVKYSGDVVIPEQISNGYSVTSINHRAFRGCRSLTSITIPSSVRYIGHDAFYLCESLSSVNISDIDAWCGMNIWGVNGNPLQWAHHLFMNGMEIKNLIIPNSVTTIREYTFSGCDGLTSVTIPNSVTSIGNWAFADCTGLVTIMSEIEKPFKIESNVFKGIPSDAELIVPKGTKSLYQEAAGWNKFTKITEAEFEVSEFSVDDIYYKVGENNTVSVTYGEVKYSGDVVIPEQVIYNGKTYSVRSIGSNAFKECGDLTSIAIPNSVESIGWDAFAYCSRLSSVTIPNSVYHIGESAFAYCVGLKTVISEIENPTNVIDYDTHAFVGVNAELIVPKGTKSLYQTAWGWKEFKMITEVGGGESKITLTAQSYSREYGEVNPVFEYTCEGDDLNGTPMISCDATAISPIGTYPIRIVKGSVSNDNVTYLDGTLTITKAPLTISAKNCSKEQGQENPAFEVTYSGFKNGETEAVLTRMPTITTTATASSPSGTYDIEVSGAEAQNYSFIYNKGVLTVTENNEVLFTIDGVTYQGSKSEKTVAVKAVNTKQTSIEIPASVNYDGITYIVSGITDGVFDGSNMAALIWDVEAALPNNAFSNASIGSNFLLYVKSSSYAPSSIKNVVVDGTAQTIVLSDDGGQFYCPQAFTARRISYSHNYSMETGKGSTMGWESIALPFDVQRIIHSTQGEIVPFAAYSSGSNQKPFWLAYMSAGGFKRTADIRANEAYIIAMPNNSSYQDNYILAGDVTFSAENITVPKTPTFNGTFLPAFSFVAKSSSVYALNVNNRYVRYSGSEKPGSIFIRDLRDVCPFEAYLTGNFTRGIIEINYDNGTTDILDVLLSTDDSQEMTIHTLNGQQVTRTTQRDFDTVWQQLPKGVYIVNGKKMIK